jgi:hypothetical protein
MILQPNYEGHEPKRFNITRMYMFAILDKEKPDTENIRDLNLAMVRHRIVQVNLHSIGNNPLKRAWTKKA